MSTLGWKLCAGAFALLALLQYCRNGQHNRRTSDSEQSVAQARSSGDRGTGISRGRGSSQSPGHDDEAEVTEDDENTWAPKADMEHWAITFLRPKDGENLLDYRDRVLPVAQAAIAPFRAKVRRSYADFKEQAALSSEQERLLEEAREQRSSAIQDRVMEAIFSGEFNGPIKPSDGLPFARSIFNEVEGMHNDVVGLLSDDQSAILHESRFDAIEYLLFGTRWEEMLGVVSGP